MTNILKLSAFEAKRTLMYVVAFIVSKAKNNEMVILISWQKMSSACEHKKMDGVQKQYYCKFWWLRNEINAITLINIYWWLIIHLSQSKVKLWSAGEKQNQFWISYAQDNYWLKNNCFRLKWRMAAVKCCSIIYPIWLHHTSIRKLKNRVITYEYLLKWV